MVSNNTQQYAPYKTYQQSTGNKPTTNNYKPPVNNNNSYNPLPKKVHPMAGAGQSGLPYNGGYAKPKTPTPGCINTDTAIAWAKKYDADNNGGLTKVEIETTAKSAEKHGEKDLSEFFNTFIYGGKDKTGFKYDPNGDRILNFHEIASLAGKDGYANGIVPEDFKKADPSQFQQGGNEIPGGYHPGVNGPYNNNNSQYPQPSKYPAPQQPYGNTAYNAPTHYNQSYPQPAICPPPVRKPVVNHCAPKPCGGGYGGGQKNQQLIQVLMKFLMSMKSH
ncbi:MAG: hypothetical protein QE263_09735 [Vampirovibrionales bacterium]|nr:hypothetical protein [Vampirovibrionales bacterium]